MGGGMGGEMRGGTGGEMGGGMGGETGGVTGGEGVWIGEWEWTKEKWDGRGEYKDWWCRVGMRE